MAYSEKHAFDPAKIFQTISNVYGLLQIVYKRFYGYERLQIAT